MLEPGGKEGEGRASVDGDLTRPRLKHQDRDQVDDRHRPLSEAGRPYWSWKQPSTVVGYPHSGRPKPPEFKERSALDSRQTTAWFLRVSAGGGQRDLLQQPKAIKEGVIAGEVLRVFEVPARLVVARIEAQYTAELERRLRVPLLRVKLHAPREGLVAPGL